MKPDADILFEVSWEVCNKIGGIYTVMKSKASLIQQAYNNNYYFVGPYIPGKVSGEFVEGIPPENMKKAFLEISNLGIICKLGKWLIPGQPSTILVDFAGYREKINNLKRELWESYKIDSLRAPVDYNEPLLWAYCTGIIINKLSESVFQDKKIVAHFHEWLSGAGILLLKSKKARVGTVFTTHATVLGRTLSSMQIDIYNIWNKINPDAEAIKYNVEGKHSLEKQSAINSDIFTTVSETTGIEAEHFLGRKPDVLVYNGLDLGKFPTFEEIAIKHRIQRDKIREFIFYFFFPYYTFEIKDTLFYFIAGRKEVRDKGIDIYIKALGELNKKLKEKRVQKTVVAFIWVPTNNRGIHSELIENRILYQDVKESLDDLGDETHKNITYTFVANKEISPKELFEEDFLLEMKGKVSRLKKKGIPDTSTHYIDENDEILGLIKAAGLSNDKESPVKIIYYPTYLTGADGLLNQTYYEAMQGSHLGIFPSFYEPWGYTPLEAGALGVSSVTTDLAGFGRYIKEQYKKETEHRHGISVLSRMNKSDNVVVNELADIMLKFSMLTTNERIASKLHARHLAAKADWKDLVKYYIEAHNKALAKII